MPRTEITLPHNFVPRPYQRDVLRAMDEGAKRVALVWHRRAGKDVLAFNIAVREMIRSPGICYYILPSYVQGRKVIWDSIVADGLRFRDFIPKELLVSKSDSDMRFTLVNGSVIQVVGSDSVDSLVGTNPRLCIFSEYALQSEKAWELLRPILAENGGKAVFMFTPRGMNHAWYFLKRAEESPDWYTSILTVDDTLAIPPSEISKERAEMDEDMFQQEYYCAFTQGDAQVFRKLQEAVHGEEIVPEDGKLYVLGIDIAKRQDFTVITPIDLYTFKVGTPMVLPTMDYTYQEQYIEREYRKWNRARVRLDSTGVGEAVADHLEHKVRLSRFYFTESSRVELLQNLKIAIETGKISLPDYKPLMEQLMAFQYSLSGSYGKVRMEAPSGVKDDMVMSLALACWDLPAKPLRKKEEDLTGFSDLAQFDAHKGKRRADVLRVFRQR